MTHAIALILAGGIGSRFGGDCPKQYVKLYGKPLLRHSLEAFRKHPSISSVRVVISPKDEEKYYQAINEISFSSPPIIGGTSRQDSALNGLKALEKDSPDFVLIHDAARPLVDTGSINRVITGLQSAQAVVPAIQIFDAIKRATGEPLTVVDSLNSKGLWRVQTPQGFHYADILAGHKKYAGLGLSDDAAVAQKAGMEIRLVHGNEENLKITTSKDLEKGHQLMSKCTAKARIGSGFDVHRFCEGDHITLCGIKIKHEKGLEGHSDADVAMHALTDALLGAMAEKDIGSIFPPSEEKWKNASSTVFLKYALQQLRNRNFAISNIDLTIICETPIIAPYREQMISSLVKILDLDPTGISVKATTTEKLGFTGRQEGIAVQASVLIHPE
tara:strand:+ start:1112 stop:2272 length:1161 start_codon:yes stop_codon:yes gene_type:complete